MLQTSGIARHGLFFLANLLAVLALVAARYHQIISYTPEPVLFFSFDGSYLALHERAKALWTTPLTFLGINPLQGAFSEFYPLNAPLIPGYWVLSLFSDIRMGVFFSQLWFTGELFALVYFAMVLFEVDRRIAAATGWLCVLVMKPLVFPIIYYTLNSALPHLTTQIGLSALVLGAFARTGRTRNWHSSVTCAALVIAIPLYLAVTPERTVLSVPFLIFGGAVVLASSRGRELKWKLGAAGVSGLLAAVTVLPFMHVLFATAPPVSLHGLHLINPPSGYYNVFPTQPLIGGDGYWQMWLVVGLAIAGTLVALVIDRGRVVPFLLLSWGATGIGIAVFWAAQFWPEFAAKIYHLNVGNFERPTWPFYFMFAARGLLALPMAGARYLSDAPQQISKLVTVLVAPLVVNAIIVNDPLNGGGPWALPPERTALIDFLAARTALRPGEPFRGRIANVSGVGSAAGTDRTNQFKDWTDQFRRDGEMLRVTGNEHRFNGLWYYDIPALTVYSSTASPTFFALVQAFLTQQRRYGLRVVIPISRFDERIMVAMGVRYVIDDRPHADLPAVFRFAAKGVPTLTVYELPGPNLGQYSPTEITTVSDAASALERIAARDFDFGRTAVTFTPISETLRAARDPKLGTEVDGLHVRATSEGWSLLVLPVSYSRCLTLRGRNTSGNARLLRVNLDQTGVLFNKVLDATISSHFAPWSWSCRYEDIADYAAMRLRGLEPIVRRIYRSFPENGH